MWGQDGFQTPGNPWGLLMGWLETGERGQSELHLLVLKHTAESVGKEENQGSFATQSSDSTTSFRWAFSDEYRELLFCLLEEASVQMVSVHWGHSSPLCLSHTHRSHLETPLSPNDPLGRVCPRSVAESETKRAAHVWFTPSQPRTAQGQPQTQVTSQKSGCFLKGWS